MNRIAIIDYGMCNLDSVARAVEECGGLAVVTDRAQDIEHATHIILPGVGAFSEAMANIRSRRLDEVMGSQVFGKQIPFLGICLGMQLLAEVGHEGGQHPGLGWIRGEVRRLQPTPGNSRIPHIGWNEVVFQRESPIFKGMLSNKDFYFVHSYHFVCDDPGDLVATTPYTGGFVSAVQREWVFAVQFHPEKSQRVGFQVLRNFIAL